MRGIEGKAIDPQDKDVSELIEELKNALSGRFVLTLLYRVRARGYALKGDYDIAVLVEPRCDFYRLKS